MKNLKENKLESLLNIIGSNPAQHIALFTQEHNLLTTMLHDYCKQRDYLYQINCTNTDTYAKMKNTFTNDKKVQVKDFTLDRKSYMMQGKQYDFLFVTTAIEENMRGDFLIRTHNIICNAGNIIIFVDKDNRTESYQWIELLEEHYYVASSMIDDLCDEYTIIISKKMHGWKGL